MTSGLQKLILCLQTLCSHMNMVCLSKQNAIIRALRVPLARFCRWLWGASLQQMGALPPSVLSPTSQPPPSYHPPHSSLSFPYSPSSLHLLETKTECVWRLREAIKSHNRLNLGNHPNLPRPPPLPELEKSI